MVECEVPEELEAPLVETVVEVEVVDVVVEVVEVEVVEVVVDVVVVIVGAAVEAEAVSPPMLSTCSPGPHWLTHITRKL